MAEDLRLREVFVKAVFEFLDPKVAARMKPLPRDMVRIIVYCLNKVRMQMDLRSVSMTLADLFLTLERDSQERESLAGDLVFFSRITPLQLQSVAVISETTPEFKCITVVGNRVMEIDAQRLIARSSQQMHFRSTSKWFVQPVVASVAKKPMSAFQFTKTYYLTEGNNSDLVAKVLEAEGFRRVGTQQAAGFIWSQVLKQIDLESVKEGRQLLSHVPGLCRLLTTKKSFRHTTKQIPNFPTPLSFDLSDQYDYVTFLTYTNASNSKWILKPFALNQGIGISLVTNLVQFRRDLQSGVESRKKIVQAYITHPLLLEGHKFDIRYYLLIARCKPVIVLRHEDFYTRRSLNPYNVNSEDLLTHLTNAHQQKAHPDFERLKEESILSKQQLEEKLGSAVVSGIERWIVETLAKLMQFVAPRLDQRLGSFELLGVDFMLDSSMRLYMLEANINPALYTDTNVLGTVIPKVVEDTIAVVTKVHAGVEDYLQGTRYKVLLPLN